MESITSNPEHQADPSTSAGSEMDLLEVVAKRCSNQSMQDERLKLESYMSPDLERATVPEEEEEDAEVAADKKKERLSSKIAPYLEDAPDGDTNILEIAKGRPLLPAVQPTARPGAYSAAPGSTELQRNTPLSPALVGKDRQEEEEALGVLAQPRLSREQPIMAAPVQPGATRIGIHQGEHQEQDVESNNHHLAVANLVADDESARQNNENLLQKAQDYDANAAAKAREKQTKKVKTYVLVGVLILIAFIIIVVLVAVFVSASNNTKDEVPAPTNTNPPSQAPTSLQDALQFLLPEETLQTVYKDPSSPQAKAFEWITKDIHLAVDTGIGNVDEQRIQQRFALATLYYATNGPSWYNNTHWLNHRVHECQWYGKPDFAEKILLRTNGQPGYLRHFLEPPPSSYCTESGLYQHLWLDQNNLVGTALPGQLGMLTHLQTLSLGSNRFLEGSSIPTQIGKLTKLEGLVLARSFQDDQATAATTNTIPSQIGRLTKLQALDLASNNLQGSIPEEIWKMTNLLYLSFFFNPGLAGTLPNDLGSTFSNLLWLVLELDNLSGTIPSEIGLMTSLETLAIGSNQMSGPIPTELGKLSNVTITSLQGNAFQGTLPSQLGGMTSTTLLLLNNNQFSGQIPSQIGLMKDLSTFLHFQGNRLLGGTVPTELGLLTKLLVELDFSNNQIAGQIPSQFAQLTLLGSLRFTNNSLSGRLPQELSALEDSLHTLTLEGNPLLSGNVPDELCSVNGTCIQDSALDSRCEPTGGLSFDCNSLLCGCACACL